MPDLASKSITRPSSCSPRSCDCGWVMTKSSLLYNVQMDVKHLYIPDKWGVQELGWPGGFNIVGTGGSKSVERNMVHLDELSNEGEEV